MSANTSKPDVTIELITPEIAEGYLSKNVYNRNPKPSKISRYARDMKDGNWKMTGEAIKFDTDGNLSDGQNRLKAIVASGCSIQMMVIRGVDPDAMAVMDSGAPRTVGDALKLSGYVNGKDLAAVANTHRAWMEGEYIHSMSHAISATKMTHAEALDYVQTHPSLEESMRFAMQLRNAIQLPVSVMGAAFDRFCDINAEDAVEFFTRLRDIRTNGTGDPIATLLKRVQQERARGRRIETALGIFMLVRAWNAFRSGERLEKIQIGSKDGGWSLMPEPK